MAENPFTSTDWMQKWNEAQQKSWNAWSSLAQKSMASSNQAMDPVGFWQKNIASQWTPQSFSQNFGMGHTGNTPEQTVIQNLFTLSRGYQNFFEELFKWFQAAQSGATVGEEWMQSLNHAMEQSQLFFSKNPMTNLKPEESGQALSGLMTLMGMPMDTWRHVASSTALTPGDMLRTTKEKDIHSASAMWRDQWQSHFEQFLSVPALGFTREVQEQLQEGAQHALEYEQAFHAYGNIFSKVVVRAIDLIREKMLLLSKVATDQEEPQKPVESMQQIFEIWIDCCEQAYSEIVVTDEYSAVSARLLNALMRVKKHSRLMMEKVLNAMDVPTRQELDTVYERNAILARHIRKLEHELKSIRNSNSLTVTKEIQKLKDNLEQMNLKSLRSELASIKQDMTIRSDQQPKPRPKKPIRQPVPRVKKGA